MRMLSATMMFPVTTVSAVIMPTFRRVPRTFSLRFHLYPQRAIYGPGAKAVDRNEREPRGAGKEARGCQE